MASQTIWIVDTLNRSSSLAEAIASAETNVILCQSTNQLAQALSGTGNGAVIANIHENEDFETLEHLSKISLTFPEIPMVLLLPEPMHAAIDWGPRVFNLIKPVSPESILRRLSFLDEHSYPTRGILQKGYLLALLDYCLLQKKQARISINYAQKHTVELWVQDGKLHSVYIDNQIKNDKVLFPFALDGAEFTLDYIEDRNAPALDRRLALSDDEYRRFRLELHPFLSLTQQFPPMSEILQIDDARLMQVLNSLPEQIHSVIRYFDGTHDLFSIFTGIELRPLETAQRIGYLYFSDVFRKTPPPQGEMPAETPAKAPRTQPSSKASSELATWLLDPVAAARELENRIRENLKSRRSQPGTFRPHRTGLGALLRPVVVDEHAEEDAEKSNWGGASTQMMRESREFLQTPSQDDAVPGMAVQEIVMEVGEEVEGESTGGIIEIGEPEPPPADAARNGKIILEGESTACGESELAPGGETLHPAFHDEPTVPLEQQSEESLQDDLAKESLSELLALRSPQEKPGKHDERFRETKQLQAFLMPDEAVPEQPAPVVAQEKTERPPEETTPSPAFEEAPNSAPTPQPEVAINDPTPVPAETDNPSPLETGASEEHPPKRPEKSLQAEDPNATARMEPASGVMVFQKEAARSSRWKAFGLVLALTALVIGAYALWGSNTDNMRARPSADTQESATKHENSVVARNAVDRPEKTPADNPPANSPPPTDAMAPDNPPADSPPPTDAMAPDNPPADNSPPPQAISAEMQEKAKNLYETYRRRGIKASLRELETLARENPGFAQAAAYLGDIYYQDGRIAKAYEWARKAIALDREQPMAWWVIGLVAYEAGRKAEYVEAFREYIRLSPNDENAAKIRQLKIRELSNP